MLLFHVGRKHNLKVREHSILGPYVDGLSTLAVSSFEVRTSASLYTHDACDVAVSFSLSVILAFVQCSVVNELHASLQVAHCWV